MNRELYYKILFYLAELAMVIYVYITNRIVQKKYGAKLTRFGKILFILWSSLVAVGIAITVIGVINWLRR